VVLESVFNCRICEHGQTVSNLWKVVACDFSGLRLGSCMTREHALGLGLCHTTLRYQWCHQTSKDWCEVLEAFSALGSWMGFEITEEIGRATFESEICFHGIRNLKVKLFWNTWIPWQPNFQKGGHLISNWRANYKSSHLHCSRKYWSHIGWFPKSAREALLATT